PRVDNPQYAAGLLLRLRFELDLWINLRPSRLLAPGLTPLRDATAIDLVVVRENTEGAYVGIGGQFKRGTADEIAIQEDINTRKGVERIQRYAFELAGQRHKAGHRGRLTMVDKSNALYHAHDLWQRVFVSERERFPEIEAEHLFVDAAAMQLVKDPRRPSLPSGGHHGRFDLIGPNGVAKVTQHHRPGEDGADRIRDPFPGMLWRRAMHRLEESAPRLRVDVGRGRLAQPAHELGSEVAQDVAEHVRGDDDVESARVLDQLHGGRVDEKMLSLDLGKSLALRHKDTLPEIMGVIQGVTLVHHGQATPMARLTALAGELEGISLNALHALSSIDVFLDRDLIGRATLELTADPD